jgi:hypothetical protein
MARSKSKSNLKFYKHLKLSKSGVKWKRAGKTYGMVFDGNLTEQQLMEKIKDV